MLLDIVTRHYQRCWLCQKRAQPTLALCEACQSALPWHEPIVGRYETPTLMTPLRYTFPITRLIHQLKFQHQLIVAHLLGNVFLHYIQKNKTSQALPQCIIPVPLHKERLKERGFNQALEIARPIARQLKVPLIIDSCRRIKKTKPQAKLNAIERGKNVKNAFIKDKPLPFSHIALLDDVVTTGHTVTELALLFKSLGVKTVEIWGCARATQV